MCDVYANTDVPVGCINLKKKIRFDDLIIMSFVV